MALFKGSIATNFFTDPRSFNDTTESMGIPFAIKAYFLGGTSQDDTDNILLVPLRPNWSVTSVKLWSDGGNTAGTLDVGLATINAAGDTITEVDFDLFASDQAIASALTGSDITLESGTVTIDELVKPLWEVVGAASDPGGYYWLTATVDTANIDAAVKLMFEVSGVR